MPISSLANADCGSVPPPLARPAEGAARVQVEVRRCYDCGQFFVESKHPSRSKIFWAYTLGGVLIGLMYTLTATGLKCPRCGSSRVSGVETLELILPPSTGNATYQSESRTGLPRWAVFVSLVPLTFVIILIVGTLTGSLLAVMATAGLMTAILYLSISIDKMRR